MVGWCWVKLGGVLEGEEVRTGYVGREGGERKGGEGR